MMEVEDSVEAFEEWLVAALASESAGDDSRCHLQNAGPEPGAAAESLARPAAAAPPQPRGGAPGAAARKGGRAGKAGGGRSRSDARETSQQRAHRMFYERKKERVSGPSAPWTPGPR